MYNFYHCISPSVRLDSSDGHFCQSHHYYNNAFSIYTFLI
ncbi:hypothetical protein Mpsy_2428 [Methanolobus psychrophilus R15]|nr:hypothetical protein Mpsy_2428 [Methanolobus psychrophilus R15]